MSFASPTGVLATIVDCLDGVAGRVHVGSRDSGLGLECGCAPDGSLLRVEAGSAQPLAGPKSVAARNCRPLVLSVIVVYRTCLVTSTSTGKSTSIDTLTAAGTGNVVSWWDALTLLSCCKPVNQSIRFVQAVWDPPEGGCFGWTMNLDADLTFCAPCPA